MVIYVSGEQYAKLLEIVDPFPFGIREDDWIEKVEDVLGMKIHETIGQDIMMEEGKI